MGRHMSQWSSVVRDVLEPCALRGACTVLRGEEGSNAPPLTRLRSWPALALACGLPLDTLGQPRIPSASQQWKRERAAGAPVGEALLILVVQTAIRCRLIGARESLHRERPHPGLVAA
jgi:hypothetical protein